MLGAVYLNWLGMAPPAMTVGRLLGIGGYLLLSMALIIWGIYCVLKGAIKKKLLLAVVGTLALFLLFVWPFTDTHGWIDDLLNRAGRESMIRQCQAGEASQVGSQSYWVGQSSWDRRMYVTDGIFVFTAYNGFVRMQEIIYAPDTPAGRWSGAISLGDGWYCWTGSYVR